MTTISKTAAEPTVAHQPSLFYDSARAGLLDLLINNRAYADRGVLLPAYVGRSVREGSGVLDPVREADAPWHFYDLDGDLSPRIDDVARVAKETGCGVLVVIHYFGRTQRHLPKLRQIADDARMVLIEDLAHGLFTDIYSGEAGTFGDAKLYSLHKMLPLANGGMTTYRSNWLLQGQRPTRPDLASTVLSYDLGAIASRRRRNFIGIRERLQTLPGLGTAFRILWEELKPGDVPQSLPVYICGNGRDRMYQDMNAQGYGMVSLYHTLVEHEGRRFPTLQSLAEHVINFPVHQDITLDALEDLVSSFEECLQHDR